MSTFKHLTFADRLKLEALLKAKVSKKEIAKILNVHISTIYREMKRGTYEHLICETWETEQRYSPDQAEEKYQKKLKEKGAGLKIEQDPELAKYIEDQMIKNDHSPAAVLGTMKRSKKEKDFKITICVATLYSYIEKGIFENISIEMLPVKRNKKPRKKKVKKQVRATKGDSIEKRPEEVKSRDIFGHWEMDTVVGPRGKSMKVMLVLTERKTRREIVELLDDHTANSVVNAMNRIERKCGSKFREIFKSITVDNGSEFADYEGMEKGRRGQKKRTKLYYCHPYSSYERGSNEVNNRFVRRKIPKGVNFDDKTPREIKAIEDWINHYPRRMFGYATSEELFQNEVARILAG